MEHEVYVPFPVGPVRAALTDRERLARCVPGLQLDAAGGAEAAGGTAGETIRGRLRVRIGSSSITYRGELTVRPEGDGIAVHGTGTEARGSGSAELELTAVPRVAQAGEGTRLVFKGGVRGDGRLDEFEEKPVTAVGVRLLDRFTAALTESIREQPPGDAVSEPDALSEPGSLSPGIGEPDDNEPAIPGIPGPEKGESDKPAATPANPTDAVEEREGEGADTDSAQDTPADAAAAGTAEREAAPTAEPDDATDGPAGAQGADAERAGDTSPDAVGIDDEDSGDDAYRADDGGEDAPAPGRAGIFETEIPPSSLDPFEDDSTDVPDIHRLDDAADAADPAATDAADDAAAADTAGAADEPAGSGTGDSDDINRVTAEAAHARRTMIGRSAEEVDHAPPRGRYAPVPSPEPAAAADTLRWAAPAAAVVVAGAVVLGRALRRRR